VVCAGGVEGADVPLVLQQDGSVMRTSDFLREVEHVAQFDWGDFYLLSATQAAKGLRYVKRGYKFLIPQSEYLVRAVDDTYVYVFSTRADTGALMATGIPWESLEKEDLQRFVFPDWCFLRAPKGGGICFPEGTKVSTPDGEEDIEDLKPGDTVYAYDFESGEVVERQIVASYKNYTYWWIDVELDGEVVTATRSHPFWVDSDCFCPLEGGCLFTGPAVCVDRA
jgi:hypothetical protein